VVGEVSADRLARGGQRLRGLQMAAQRGGGSVKYNRVEGTVAQSMARLERATHQELLPELDVDAPRLLIGGKTYERVGRSDGNYYTLAGVCEGRRTQYREVGQPQGPLVDPVSLRAGVVLGGLAALFEITGDRAYLQQGEAIASAVLAKLVTPASAHPPGILIEPCERAPAGCNGDQAQFKGIFIRYLYEFWLQSRQPAYRTFILANARSVWDNNTNASHQFGLRWTGPFDRADAARQSSALDALNAAVALAG